MKKSESRSYKDFPSTIFYLNDLLDLINFIRPNVKNLTIRAEEYNLDNVDELKDLINVFQDGRIPGIEIIGHDPRISINIQSYGIRVYISEESTITLAVVQKTQEIAARHKRIIFLYAAKYAHWLFFLPIVPLYISGYKIAALSLILPSLASAWICINLEVKSRVKIYVRKKSDFSSFFSRKKDDIFVALISAIIGSLVTILIAYVVK